MLVLTCSVARNTFTARFLQAWLPKRTIRLPSMELATIEDVGKIVRPALDRGILENIEDLNRNNPKDFMEAFLKKNTAFAILSHRWSDDELSFQDICKLSLVTPEAVTTFIQQCSKRSPQSTSTEVINKLVELSGGSTPPSDGGPTMLHRLMDLCPHISECTGLVKLIKFCDLAFEQHKCELAWIDTCCINKTSSAELDESIRSMFRWYRNSSICIVHLGSTKSWPPPSPDSFDLSSHDPWFSRGWTLQELLAPRVVKFYGSKWKPCTTASNDKSDQLVASVTQARGLIHLYGNKTMVDMLSTITSIPTTELLDFEPGLEDVKLRLSWASQRATTRIEDMAYCLLGLFNVSMPIAYGEGEVAFYRLQAAIMERSNDRNLFLWTGRPSPYSSMLANGPECFKPRHGRSDNHAVHRDMDESHLEPTYTLTNNGLRIPVSLYNRDYTATWLDSLPEYQSTDQLDRFDRETQKQCRLAVLGHSASGRPIHMLLFVRQFRDHVYYERYTKWQPCALYDADRKPGKPEIIFIK
ncbi:hypothetical protein GALMADRAFT_569193 [Galerina marginata CBS 339.88]|uniref:Heterokaryon incompatibility domain-containing protein n=1 Tax=Galerina marginata (strain CBS 339.88) TaxID=685588 RepID=A0A067SY52_GALM3|nr:hypothetical protein GALMADRAFT_569193 [Galerina marginata CBS 339.88]